MKVGSVYLYEDELTKNIKIGVSNNFKERVKALNRNFKITPGRLYITDKINQPLGFEKILHQTFEFCALGMEWFCVDFNLCKDVIKKRIKTYKPILKIIKKERKLELELRLMGLSQTGAALKSGISRTTLNAVICGREKPSADTIKKLRLLRVGEIRLSESAIKCPSELV